MMLRHSEALLSAAREVIATEAVDVDAMDQTAWTSYLLALSVAIAKLRTAVQEIELTR